MPAAGEAHGGRVPSIGRILAHPGFQAAMTRLPFGSWFARRDGAAIFDVLQGFVASQALSALVETGILRRLLDGPMRAEALALATGIPPDRLEVLLRAGVALKLLKDRRGRGYCLARRGAVILGVPGLESMILHNAALYADLKDPVALLRDPDETELARFWPYVLQGGGGAEVARRYSDLMAQSQALVAEDTLRQVPLRGISTLMDVGGGTGAFLSAAVSRHPGLSGILVDLPDVVDAAADRLARAGTAARIRRVPCNFRNKALPAGADALSLVRVLYDHQDETVLALLARAFDALPAGGLLIVSEPMSGGARPDAATDVYFAFYTMAMGTGRVRSQARIADLCRDAGFTGIRQPRSRRPFITSVVTAVKPA